MTADRTRRLPAARFPGHDLLGPQDRPIPVAPGHSSHDDPGPARARTLTRDVMALVRRLEEEVRLRWRPSRPVGRPPVVDIVLTLFVAMCSWPLIWRVWAVHHDALSPLGAALAPWAACVAVLLFSVPFLWRRSAPLGVALAVAAGHLIQVVLVSEPTTGNIAAPIAMYSVARWGADRRIRRGGLVLAAAGSVIAGLSWTRFFVSAERGSVLDILFAAAFITLTCLALTAAAWLLGALVRQRARSIEQMREKAAAVERGRVQNIRLAAQEERARIAREMHDVVAHSLSVIVVQSDGAAYALESALGSALASASPGEPASGRGPGPGPGPDALGSAGSVDAALVDALRNASAVLTTIGNTARESLADTRRLVSVLRQDEGGADYAPTGGVDSLGDLIEPLRAAGLEIRTDVGGRPRPLSRASDLAVYRVVQEALTNVIKHAGDAQVWVSLDYLDGALLITVRDDGAGVTAPPDGHGHGLVGMKERLTAVGGSLWAGGAPGGGFLVEARIPYDAADRHGPGETGAQPWTT